MKLVLKKVGEMTCADAEGTPEELAEFAARMFPELRAPSEVWPPRLVVGGDTRGLSVTPPPAGCAGAAAFSR